MWWIEQGVIPCVLDSIFQLHWTVHLDFLPIWLGWVDWNVSVGDSPFLEFQIDVYKFNPVMKYTPTLLCMYLYDWLLIKITRTESDSWIMKVTVIISLIKFIICIIEHFNYNNVSLTKCINQLHWIELNCEWAYDIRLNMILNMSIYMWVFNDVCITRDMLIKLATCIPDKDPLYHYIQHSDSVQYISHKHLMQASKDLDQSFHSLLTNFTFYHAPKETLIVKNLYDQFIQFKTMMIMIHSTD